MWPDSSFAKPVSSFERPVPLNLIPPNSEQYLYVKFNKAWLPYVLGSLKQLMLQTTWQTEDAQVLNLQQELAGQILYEFSIAVGLDVFIAQLIGMGEDECMQFRIKPTDPCIIQTLCGDGTWLDWYDPRGCIPGAVAQPGPQPQPGVGQCEQFDVKLDGNGIYHLPVPVSGGDTITISQAQGGWYDSTYIPWRCPSGLQYTLGNCGGTTMLLGTDPMPAQPHMRLIASLNGTYYDAFDQVITVPAGLTAVDMTFQANDSALGNNAGSVSFHLNVCHNSPTPSGDCLESNFLIDAQGWSVEGGGAHPAFGHYQAGVGWQSDYLDSGTRYQTLIIVHPYTTHIGSMKINFSNAQTGMYAALLSNDTSGEGGTLIWQQFLTAGDNQEISVPLNFTPGNHVRLGFQYSPDATADHGLTLTHVELCP